MEDFKKAQRLFTLYQNNGEVHYLREALDILSEIIAHDSPDSHKAVNFKKTISRHLDNQIKGIFVKCNIKEFAKDLKSIDDHDILIDKLATVLSAAFSKEDGVLFIELLNIKSDYFPQASPK